MTDHQLTAATGATFAAPMSEIDETSRTITGQIVAYGTTTQDGRRIIIETGALVMPADLRRAKLLVDHDHSQPIGYMTSYEQETGHASFTVAEGERGNQALSDARQGLRDGLSVGLAFDSSSDYTINNDDQTVTIHRARVLEVSLVALPAFADARVSDVTASAQIHYTTADTADERETMTDTTTETGAVTALELDTALDKLAADMRREIAAAGAHDEGTPAPHFASLGDYVKKLAAGDTAAMDMHHAMTSELAYDGATTADYVKRNTWIADAIKLVEKRRRVMQWFTSEPLPSEGMTLEYAVLKADDTQVAEQVNQGDSLVGGEIVLGSETTPVRTFGGYAKVTRQVIDRLPASYLTTLFKAMAIKYAAATEKAAVSALDKAITAQAATSPLKGSTTMTAQSWLDLAVDAVQAADDRGHVIDGLLVDPSMFKQLLALETKGGDRLMGVYGNDVNQVGRIDLNTLTGKLSTIDVIMLPSLKAGQAVFADKLAFTSWESPGAPMQLQDDSIIDLTKAFSIYGYAAFAAQFPQGLIPVTGLTATATDPEPSATA